VSLARAHGRMRSALQRKGAAVTFTWTVSTTDPLTGETTTVVSSVAGHAVQDHGATSPEEYQRLALVESEAPTLFFTPTTVGEKPELGATCTWGGDAFTVRSVRPFAPAGTALGAYVVVSR